MTTIAWDGKTLAGDRQIIVGDRVFGETTKVHRRKDGSLIAIGRGMCRASEYLRWFMKGEKGKAPSLESPMKDGAEGHVLIIRKNGVVEDYDAEGWHTVEGKFAIGTGGGMAMVAMHMGATAEDAVKFASKFDIYTGSEVDTVSQ